ncbi:MAG: NapC/NirT family cytochrome c [Pseudomonadales bacterium]|nr:NapC/NirT family cytochrome c [Pseudomonadales bacterium]
MDTLKKVWRFLTSPASGYAAWILLATGGVAGALALVTFDQTLEATSTQSFCTSCHEMEAFSYAESRERIHASNRSGIEATCSDCHVPHEFVPKMVRKIEAAREVYHHILGTIDTPEKYAAYKPQMIARVHERMRGNDSANCRSCHVNVLTQTSLQRRPAQMGHKEAIGEGKTCIDCHQGIAHDYPQPEPDEEDDFRI